MKSEQTFNSARNAANSAVNKTQGAVNDLQSRAVDAVEEGASTVSRLVDKVGDYINSGELEHLATQAGQKVGRMANEASRTATQYVQKSSDRVRETADEVESHIKDKPLQSTLIAFGLGYLLAKLFDSRAN